jgi:inner membrane protein
LKTGFREHLLASLAVAIAAVLALPTTAPFLASLTLFILSSLLPDIDHPKSIPRKAFKHAVFWPVLFASFIIAQSTIACEGIPCLILYAVVALIASRLFLLAIELLIPKHRGKIHSKIAGLVLGAFVLAVSYPFAGPVLSLSFGLFSFLGYSFHLLVDFIGDRLIA